jgi:hypothetical protein
MRRLSMTCFKRAVRFLFPYQYEDVTGGGQKSRGLARLRLILFLLTNRYQRERFIEACDKDLWEYNQARPGHYVEDPRKTAAVLREELRHLRRKARIKQKIYLTELRRENRRLWAEYEELKAIAASVRSGKEVIT